MHKLNSFLRNFNLPLSNVLSSAEKIFIINLMILSKSSINNGIQPIIFADKNIKKILEYMILLLNVFDAVVSFE